MLETGRKIIGKFSSKTPRKCWDPKKRLDLEPGLGGPVFGRPPRPRAIALGDSARHMLRAQQIQTTRCDPQPNAVAPHCIDSVTLRKITSKHCYAAGEKNLVQQHKRCAVQQQSSREIHYVGVNKIIGFGEDPASFLLLRRNITATRPKAGKPLLPLPPPGGYHLTASVGHGTLTTSGGDEFGWTAPPDDFSSGPFLTTSGGGGVQPPS